MRQAWKVISVSLVVTRNLPRGPQDRSMRYTILFLAAALSAQEPKFRAESRMLQIEVLLGEARSKVGSERIGKEAFRLKIDGRRREIAHVSHQGGERRPLAILVYLNLAPEGAFRKGLTKETAQSFREALNGLATEDEVGIYAVDDWFAGAPRVVSEVGADRNAAAKGLEMALEGVGRQTRANSGPPREKTITAAVEEARRIAKQRPGSLVTLLYVSDGMNTMDTFRKSDQAELAGTILGEGNLSVSAIRLPMMGAYAAAAQVLNPLGFVMGYSVTGATSKLAEQSGGIVMELESAEELSGAFVSLLRAYRDRYLVEAKLDEKELRDGKVHKIELSVTGVDPRKVRYRRALRTQDRGEAR